MRFSFACLFFFRYKHEKIGKERKTENSKKKFLRYEKSGVLWHFQTFQISKILNECNKLCENFSIMLLLKYIYLNFLPFVLHCFRCWESNKFRHQQSNEKLRKVSLLFIDLLKKHKIQFNQQQKWRRSKAVQQRISHYNLQF